MRRALRFLAVALACAALVVVAVSLALDPLATWRTRRMLRGVDGINAHFSKVSVSVRDLSYQITDLRIEKRRGEEKALPLFEARSIRLELLWRELVRGKLVGRVDLDRPRLNVVEASGPGEQDEEVGNPRARAAGQEVQETPALWRKVAQRTPFLLDRVRVRRGEALWIDAREPGKPSLRIHEIEATFENLAPRPALAREAPTVLAARGTIQGSGRASVFATADPLARKLTFAGHGMIQGLELAELEPLLASKNDVVPERGTVDLSLRFRAEAGRLSSGVRPVLHGVGTRPAKPGPLPKLKSFLADASLNIFKDDAPGRSAAETTIPIEGRLDDPELRLLPTLLGVVRNSFVRGLSDALRGVPTPAARKADQARRPPSPGREPRALPDVDPLRERAGGR